MSDSETKADEAIIPGFAARIYTAPHEGSEARFVDITFGENPPHKITVRELDLADQFDLVELGGESADNQSWLGMASVAASIRDIDGVPVAKATRKDHLRATLKRIPPLGVKAISKGMAMLNGTTGEALVAAKN